MTEPTTVVIAMAFLASRVETLKLAIDLWLDTKEDHDWNNLVVALERVRECLTD